MAGRQGLEPRYADPESAVLPLDDLPMVSKASITIAAMRELVRKRETRGAKSLIFSALAC